MLIIMQRFVNQEADFEMHPLFNNGKPMQNLMNRARLGDAIYRSSELQ